MMCKIIISRTSQRVNSLRYYDIYVDEQKFNIISDGEKKALDIPPGNHQIYLKIDWCKSKKLNVTLTEGQELNLKCGSEIIGIKLLFVFFYLFIPNKWVYLDYLSDGEVILNNKNYKNWNEVRSKGIINFILKYGIIMWGIPTGIIFSILMLLTNPKIHSLRSFILSTLIILIIFSLFGGLLFGFMMWKISERKNT